MEVQNGTHGFIGWFCCDLRYAALFLFFCWKSQCIVMFTTCQKFAHAFSWKKYCQRNQLPQCTDAKKQWQQIETNWVTTQNAGKVVEFETRWNVQNRERFVREIELTISRTSYFQNLKHFFSFNERCLEWNGVYWSYCFSDIVCIFVFQWF